MSNDFFEMVLPRPWLSVAVVEDFTDFLATTSAFAWTRLFEVYSESLPLLAIGDGCLLDMVTTGVCISELGFKGRVTTAAPGRDLPAETGLSAGSVVLRFGGVSSGKSGGTIGLRATRVAEGNGDGREWRREGVEGREGEREVADGRCKLAGRVGLEIELGVDGLEACDVLVLLVSVNELVELGSERGRSALGGVGVVVWREVGVEGLAADGDRVMGEDGLVLRMEEDLFGLRVTEPLLAGLE